jgi:hypothetical protein
MERLIIVNKTLGKQKLERMSTNCLTLESENTGQESCQPEPILKVKDKKTSSEDGIDSAIPVIVKSVRRSKRVVGTELMNGWSKETLKNMDCNKIP